MASTTFGDANAGFQAGTINGPVHNSYHLPPEKRSQTPPRPTAVIPFPRDADFVERGAILDDVHDRCATSGSRAALVGLGGVGKSQLAIEYAYRTRELSPETWVLWAYASNAGRFEQSYREIADRVDLAGRQDPQANIFKLMYDWMCSGKHKWLLVLDNVDDARFLLDVQPNGRGQTADAKTASKPLREYLPYCEHGSILVTTRNKEAALELVEQRDIIAVEPMDKGNAVALFKKKLGTQADSSEVAKLATVLEYMPLAIVQAAAYISQRSARYSVAKYLDDYMKSERKRTNLLDYDKGQLRRDWEAKNSIIVTWQISFEHIKQTRPSAADLLSLMSFFDRQGIPEHLLRSRGPTDDNASKPGPEVLDSDEEDGASQSSASAEESENDGFEDDVVLLHNYSFISSETNGTSFEMHALVQLATQRWLSANCEFERWKQQFIGRLYAAFPMNGKFENWTACQALFPHAKSAAALKPKNELSLADWASILFRAAWYMLERRDTAEAKQLAMKSMTGFMKVLGHDDEVTLKSMHLLGLVYTCQGRWSDAEELQVQVMERTKTMLGEDHLNTLWSMHNLARTYLDQGRLDEAEELQEQVEERRKMKQGEDHPDTLSSMNNLAITYLKQGRLDQAEELLEQVVERSKIKLGEGHPDTLSRMNNLAETYREQGRLDEAEELLEQVVERSKIKLGEGHPDILSSMNNLAETYREQGRLDEAEELLEQVVERHKTKLGEDHPHTLTSMGNLALTYWCQDRLDKAEDIQEQVMKICKTKLGDDHPHTLRSMNNLAFTWKSQNRDMDAIRLMSECVQRMRRVLGIRHPRYLKSMRTLTGWEAEQADNDQAREPEGAALDVDRNVE